MLDAWLVPFLTENPVSLMLIFAILKVIAKATPWAADDEILQILTGLTPKK